jgi:hypothetical protein
VLILVLIFVLVWAGLVAVLWAGSLWFQAYIYSEPDPELYWRAPAAGAALALFLALWGMLAYKSPGSYPPLFDLSPTDRQEFDKLKAQIKDEVRTYHMRRSAQGFPEYRDERNRPLPTHPQAIIVEEDGEEHRFNPEMEQDEKHYKIKQGQALQYRDDLGRVMSEDRVGQLSIPRWGRFWGNVLLYLGFLAVWFLGLWLLLRFQWMHALGIAVVFWLVMTIVVLPMLLTKVAAVARQT